jgi:M6 family metalloprotease-like protein
VTGCGGDGGDDDVNTAPLANAGENTFIEVNHRVDINGTGSDTDGTITAYQWTEANGTVIATTASFGYTPTTTGVHTLTLTVTDDDNATGSDTVDVTVERVQALIVIRVEFDDYQFEHDATTWHDKIFGNSEGNLNHYYREISYHSFKFSEANESDGVQDGVVTVRLAYNHPGEIENNLTALRDAAIAADTSIDYSRYDRNGDNAIQANELQIMFLVAGGERATGANPGVWAHKWCMYGGNAEAPTLDGVKIMNCGDGGLYSTFGEKHSNANTGHDATIGVIAHELGHAVFGLPDLYDTDDSSEGIGKFGLMGAGSWGYKNGDTHSGQTPVHMTGWSKVFSQFVSPVVISNSQNNLDVNKTASMDYTLYKLPTDQLNEYFLIENRHADGYDRGLYSLNGTGNYEGGLLIMHIDDSKAGNQDETHKKVDIEEANEVGLDAKTHRGHYKNLFYAGNSDDFSGATTPGSKKYDGNASGIRIHDISTHDATMHVDIQID